MPTHQVLIDPNSTVERDVRQIQRTAHRGGDDVALCIEIKKSKGSEIFVSPIKIPDPFNCLHSRQILVQTHITHVSPPARLCRTEKPERATATTKTNGRLLGMGLVIFCLLELQLPVVGAPANAVGVYALLYCAATAHHGRRQETHG